MTWWTMVNGKKKQSGEAIKAQTIWIYSKSCIPLRICISHLSSPQVAMWNLIHSRCLRLNTEGEKPPKHCLPCTQGHVSVAFITFFCRLVLCNFCCHGCPFWSAPSQSSLQFREGGGRCAPSASAFPWSHVEGQPLYHCVWGSRV